MNARIFVPAGSARNAPGENFFAVSRVSASPYEIAGLVKTYRLRQVTGDRYAAGWVRQAFGAESITYREAKLDKAGTYIETLPLFSQGRIEILDHKQQARELQCLERRTRAGGKDVVDHPRGGHDDYANALALAAVASVKAARELPNVVPISITQVNPWLIE